MTALGLVHVVRRDEDRHATRDQREQAFPEVTPALWIDGARGLVEQQQLGFVQRSRGECKSLPLASAQRAGALLEQGREIELVRDCGDACATLRSAHPEHLAHELQVLVHREIVPERELLRHVAEARAHLLGIARHVVPQDVDRSRGGTQQPAQHADGGRLARAVRPEEAVDAGTWDVEIDAVHRPDCTEYPRETARRDGVTILALGGCPSSGRTHGRAAGTNTWIGTPAGNAAAAASSSVTSAR